MLNESMQMQVFQTIREKCNVTMEGDYETKINGFGYFVIAYIHKSSHRIVLKPAGNRIDAEVTPGNMLLTEKQRIETSRELINCIEKWVHRIDSELLKSSKLRSIRESREALRELMEEQSEFPDEKPTNEQLIQLLAKIDELQATIEAQIKDQIKDDQKRDEEIEKLKGEINIIKEQAYTSTQRRTVASVFMRLKKYWGTEEASKAIENTMKTVHLLSGEIPEE